MASNIVIAVSTVFMAFATIVIAYYGFTSYRLSSKIKENETDLIKALVISNLLSRPKTYIDSAEWSLVKDSFDILYDGKEIIFKK